MKRIKDYIGKLCLKYLIPKPPIVDSNKIKIACIGDSITYGAGVPHDHEHNTWEYFLGEKLGGEYQVLNYGISGRTLLDEGDFPYRKEKFYNISRQIKAEIYILMLGTNDSKPYNWNTKRFQKQYREFVDSYLKLENKPKVYLMAPPHCFQDEETGIVGYDIIAETVQGEIHNFILEYAKENDIPCIDLDEGTKEHPEWFDDGVHPNAVGNRALADLIYSVIFN